MGVTEKLLGVSASREIGRAPIRVHCSRFVFTCGMGVAGMYVCVFVCLCVCAYLVCEVRGRLVELE